MRFEVMKVDIYKRRRDAYFRPTPDLDTYRKLVEQTDAVQKMLMQDIISDLMPKLGTVPDVFYKNMMHYVKDRKYTL